jgi:hypothetical protein
MKTRIGEFKIRLSLVLLGFFLGITGILNAQFAGGDGSPANPFRVSTAVHLDSVRYFPDKHFIQTAHIDLYNVSHSDGKGWMPIGGAGTGQKFSGRYDGKGYYIFNLYINRPDSPNVGLFGHIGHVVNTTDTTQLRNVRLINVTVSGARGTGSLVGRVTGNANTLIEGCFAVNGTVTGDAATGGLVGSNNSYLETPGGVNNPVISASYADIDVFFSGNGTDNQKFGGLAGCNQKGNVTNSYSRGSVIITSPVKAVERIGGLVGCTDLRGKVEHSFSTGSVLVSGPGIALTGGLVGNREGKGANAGVVTNSYWDTQTSGYLTSAGGMGYTTSQMKSQSSFTGFDFSVVWILNVARNDGYPELRWQPVYYPADLWSWEGAVSTAWGTPSNWNRGTFPGNNVLVRISPSENHPVIAEGTTYNLLDVEIQKGAILSVNPGASLTLSGRLVNLADSSGLVLKSDNTSSGSLIDTTKGVRATVERYINKDRWYMVSAAVKGQEIPAFLLNTANQIPLKEPNYGMMFYSEPQGGWRSYTTTSNSGEMVSGQGYLVRRQTADGSVISYGELNTGDIDIAITRERNGWNAIGNPFPSAIGVTAGATSIQNFISRNAKSFDPMYAALYLWDEPSPRVPGVSYYKIISNAGFQTTRESIGQNYLQPGQGFIVKAKKDTVMTFTREMRLHQHASNNFFKKSTGMAWPGIQLRMSTTAKAASTVVTFHRNMTLGLDVTYDAGMLGGDPSFRLYTRLIEDNGVNFAIQCLPDYSDGPMIVSLGVDYKEGGVLTFAADGTVVMPAGFNVLLEDRQTGIYTDLGKAGAVYSLAVPPATSGTGRFFLHFTQTALSAPVPDLSAPEIYSFNGEIYINGRVEGGSALLYDLTGRLVKSYRLEASEQQVFPAGDIPSGIYILRVQGAGIHESRRLFL